jgi:plastocyanin
MPAHLALVALATAAAAAPAHSADAHLPLSRHVAAASSFGPPPSTTTKTTKTTHLRTRRRRPAVRHASARSASDPPVTIADFHFTPPSSTVHVGDTITWTNDGPSSHTATARDGSFDTGTLSKGQSASHTFTRAGTFAYVCTIHPFMHGTITVLAAATTAPQPTTTTSASPTTTTSAAPSSTLAQTTTTTARAATVTPTLPATGMDVLGAIAASAVLIGSGLALRRAVRA